MATYTVIPVLHNTNSSQRVAEVARIAYGLGYKTLVLSRVYGPAAQVGIPEAQKLALRHNCNLIVLSDLPEVVELLRPNVILVAVPGKYGGRELSEVLKELEGKTSGGEASRIAVVFGGAEPGLSQKEMKTGELVHPDGVEEDIGSTGVAAVTLYLVARWLSLLRTRGATTREGV